MIASETWTGRPPYAGTPIELLRWKVGSWLYPGFKCELCVGQEESQGCYCAYYRAVAPNFGPERWRVFARAVAERLLGVRG